MGLVEQSESDCKGPNCGIGSSSEAMVARLGEVYAQRGLPQGHST